jgi:hypothetical protein
MAQPNVLIAVPAYGDSIRRGCAMSLLALEIELSKRGIGHSFKTDDMSDVYAMRNAFASFFIQEAEFTHLFFVDSDMIFKPSALLRALAAKKTVVGYAYPKRRIDLDTALDRARRGADNETAVSMASEFAYKGAAATIDRSKQPLSVDGIGAGLLLLQRSALIAMLDTGKVRTQHDHGHGPRSGLKGPLYGFFDPFLQGSHLLPDDYSFCARFKELTGQHVFAFFDEDVGHAGIFTFRAKPIVSPAR